MTTAKKRKRYIQAAKNVGVFPMAIFMETHPEPEKALSDGPNAWPLPKLESLLDRLKDIDQLVKSQPFEESLL